MPIRDESLPPDETEIPDEDDFGTIVRAPQQ